MLLLIGRGHRARPPGMRDSGSLPLHRHPPRERSFIMGDYRIRSGDTLSSIAQRYNTSVDALMKANTQIKDANVILADDKLNIPGAKDEFVEGGGTPGGPSGPGQQYHTAGPESVEGPAEIGEMPEGQVGDWIRQATEKLKAAGVPVEKMNPQDIAKIIQHESSGNPNAINLWDDNAKRGTPSIGLMQTIQPTFDAYKLPGHDNIRDPVDNIIAAVRYSIDRYGSVSNVPGLQSMNGGGGYVGY
ncbi:transglycosylase SLT domain-containing protein [Cystobacter fuscus]|nr:transglycosylase SLT domain-containing protein [Cystobacter fuscus]